MSASADTAHPPGALAIIQSAGAEICRPWLRHVIDARHWAALPAALAQDRLSLLALWADTVQVHALFLDDAGLAAVAASVPVEQGAYHGLSSARPGAAWYERMIRDLWGHMALGGTDGRSWLDHGHWPLTHPLALRPEPGPAEAPFPDLLGSDETGVMQLPIGPVSGTIEEPAHVRLTMMGERIVHAESRLGYAHRGALALMRGKSPRVAARFAARLAADATVAHSIAFATATEAALDTAAPPRAQLLRVVMAEIERIAGHLASFGAVAEAMGAERLRLQAAQLREVMLRATEAAFGHRLMMDCVVPGGVAADITPEGAQAILLAMGSLASGLPALRRSALSSSAASRLDGAGVTPPAQISLLAVGGVTGRAAGRSFDSRVFAPPYLTCGLRGALDSRGDAAARCRVRLAEIEESLRMLGALLEALPGGETTVALPMASGEGIGTAESVRGDIWTWLRLDHGQIAAVFPRDPAWYLWPMAETVLTGAAFEDIGLIRASIGLPAAGADL